MVVKEASDDRFCLLSQSFEIECANEGKSSKNFGSMQPLLRILPSAPQPDLVCHFKFYYQPHSPLMYVSLPNFDIKLTFP